ncbi:MAG: disulfide bond formation protein B [Parvibaculaceae bacterium]|nr:disulfide bond formation protein B [Parvibaculaceae bacterium]
MTHISSRLITWLLFLGCTATILAALAFQYLGGLKPCELCLLERLPYYAGVPLTLAAVFTAREANFGHLPIIILALCALVFLTGTGLGLYHVGVEQRWWVGPAACTGTFIMPTNAADLQSALSGARVVRCDVPAWTFLGISMAAWNMLISAVLTLLAAVPVRRFLRDARGEE